MQETIKYYGLSFPDDLEIGPELKYKLAQLLFASPTTGVDEVKTIIRNKKLIKAVNSLIDTLNCELDSIDSTKSKKAASDKVIVIEKLFEKKFNLWIQEFGVPTENEISSLLEANNIPLKGVWEYIYKKSKMGNCSSSKHISDYLSQYVIGQEQAVKTMSVLISEHNLRMKTESVIPRTSALIIGGTGSGKTLLINKSRDLLDVPLQRINCAGLVPVGIVGTTLEKMMTALYLSTDSNLSQTSIAMLHFDELDKLSRFYHKDDEFKSTIQLEILHYFDLNEEIKFSETQKQYADLVSIKSNKLMLVFSGAFSGIEDIILSRLLKEQDGKLKFVDTENILHYCSTQDLINYGIIPELAGRLSYICPLNKLGKNDMYNILTSARDSYFQTHLNKCKLMGINLIFADDALRYLSEKITSQNIGVRGVNAVLSGILNEIYFNAELYSGKETIVSSKTIQNMLLKQKYAPIISQFETSFDLAQTAAKFNVSIDDILDIYSQWKRTDKS